MHLMIPNTSDLGRHTSPEIWTDNNSAKLITGLVAKEFESWAHPASTFFLYQNRSILANSFYQLQNHLQNMTTASLYSNPLPRIRRCITTHNKDGKAIFSDEIDANMDFWQVGNDPDMPVGFFLGYTTSTFPAPLLRDKDLGQYKTDLNNSQGTGLVKHGGTVMRYVDYPPKCTSPMHRTISLDYGFLLQGEIHCVLDSGETTALKPGDVVVQRGTMHQWENRSETEWARMVYVLQHADGVEVRGQSLLEDLASMKGVPGSH